LLDSLISFEFVAIGKSSLCEISFSNLIVLSLIDDLEIVVNRKTVGDETETSRVETWTKGSDHGKLGFLSEANEYIKIDTQTTPPWICFGDLNRHGSSYKGMLGGNNPRGGGAICRLHFGMRDFYDAAAATPTESEDIKYWNTPLCESEKLTDNVKVELSPAEVKRKREQYAAYRKQKQAAKAAAEEKALEDNNPYKSIAEQLKTNADKMVEIKRGRALRMERREEKKKADLLIPKKLVPTKKTTESKATGQCCPM
jgi:hypothetical protein